MQKYRQQLLLITSYSGTYQEEYTVVLLQCYCLWHEDRIVYTQNDYAVTQTASQQLPAA